MTVNELKTRCKQEFKVREHGKWVASKVFMILALVHIGFVAIQLICLIASGTDFIINPVFIIFNLVLWGISGTISNGVNKTVRKYKKSGEYMNLRFDHPYSLMYPGESYPFNNNLTYQTPAMAAAPAYAYAAAGAPAPAAVSAQPQQVTITCEHCGQQMLVPMTGSSFRITCPKCGNSSVHNN